MTSKGIEKLSELLTRLPTDQYREFVHRCIDEICGRKGPDRELFCSSGQWNHDDYSVALTGLKEFVVNAVVHQYDTKKVESILMIGDEKLKGIMTCLTVRKDEVQEMLLNRLSKPSGISLQDFDWKIKWVMGSSTLSSLQEPLLELDLFVTEQQQQKLMQRSEYTKCISIELSQDSLTSLINALEVANESLSV